MKINLEERGVLPASQRFMHDNAPFACQHLTHLEFAGNYQCDEGYQINREGIASHLLFVIGSGNLRFEIKNDRFVAHAGAIVWIERNLAHKYYAVEPVCFKWFHFVGSLSDAYCKLLTGNRRPLFYPSNFKAINNHADQILSRLERSETGQDHWIAAELGHIFANLAESGKNEDELPTTNALMLQAAEYIENHCEESISVDYLAEKANFSKYYFIRLFRKVMFCTPYEYLINCRLSKAKRMLLSTDMSVEAIANSLGFSSASHFIKTFRENYGCTPQVFRNIKL
ncbi:MAG: AraC family transcriptional regulator [Fastidiosipilaceae bacterium]|jgi:AraC-like DNA-binding protein|nr:AraC family transcriptional regulator [Clostridiaceae bacterium]